MSESAAAPSRPSAAAEGLAARLRTEISEAIRMELGPQLTEMRRFVDRRFAELSAEVHASATMAEMTEASLAGQIGRVQQEVARIIAAPTAETRNTGLELEAVVQGTEVAANQILEAAESIMDWLGSGAGVDGAAAINDKLQSIFEACSFQDLTSQRIRRAIRHLEQVDTMLTHLAAAEPSAPPNPVPTGPGGTGADLDQSTIDSLFGSA